MLKKIRKSKWTKVICLLLSFQIITNTVGINYVFAGDGGPTQPEVHSFEPVGTDQMVDLFTGDFTYNIPLFNIPGPNGGYPINLAYHSGVHMDQEASWVGLGWNINMGTINRQVRNMPDDFNGDNDKIKIKTDFRPNWTTGIGYNKQKELFGLHQELGSFEFIPTKSFGGSIYFNNYRGIGYSVDLGFSIKIVNCFNDKISGDLGYNLNLDSQEGISNSVTAGVGFDPDRVSTNVSVGTGFNSRVGWNRSIKQSVSISKNVALSKKLNLSGSRSGSTISLASPVVHSSIPNEMKGKNIGLSFSWGYNIPYNFTKKTTNMYYNDSKLENNEEIIYNGFGYMNFEDAQNSNSSNVKDRNIRDFSTEDAGMVHKNTRRLGVPQLSYDIYSVTGQGIGNMFRPFRADIFEISPMKVKSEYYGGNIGFERLKTEIPGALRKGIDIGFNYSSNKIADWPNTNAINSTNTNNTYSLSNSVYFQNYGELSSDNLASNYGISIIKDKPLAYGLNAADNFYDITNYDQNSSGESISIITERNSRKIRALGTEAFTNELIMGNGNTVIPEFETSFYTSSNSSGYNKVSRENYTSIRNSQFKNHVGGYISTNDQGMRYVYALPALNKKERDVVFSVKEENYMLNSSYLSSINQESNAVDYKVPGTDQYYNSSEKGEYAHSYLLTSILGDDYVDFDAVKGASDGDLGYWVKVDYLKAHDSYRWRTPYSGALYDKGNETSFKDGKGRYSYGEKEIWYVATVETKTHIAEFIVSPRSDSKQVANELDGLAGSGSYYKLDKINVYSKNERYPNGVYNANAKPIQTCHFTYDYSLCKKTPDNDGVNGKLTLKKVHFTYRNNSNGVSNPYTFEYNNQVNGQDVDFNRESVDRWGNYQPSNSGSNIDYPYNDPYTTKNDMDQRAALWNIKAINLPSGGRYEVDYESDSYAYVQNEVAMHMFKIASLRPYSYGSGGVSSIQHDKDDTDDKRKVYFKLEKPISTTLSVNERLNLVKRYIKPLEYLYFKVKINLTNDNTATDYVAGYSMVKEVGIDESSAVGGNYQWGYVLLDFIKIDGDNTHFHPFTEAGARHLRYNQPELVYDNPPNANKNKLSISDVRNMGWSLLSNAKDIEDIFRDFTAMMYKDGNNRLSDIQLDKSYIRLRTPDKIKFGGGHRVKEIRIIDNWVSSFLTNGENSSTYATVYEYETTDANGEKISSGVASYEPMVGGDEIPLRNPVKGWEDKNIATKSVAQTYTEDPGNENLFPGASVGYSKVRVLSKNTKTKQLNLNQSMSYTGISETEFYTAKDYPVISTVSDLENGTTFRKSRLIIPALIVNIDRLRMAASQGYYIELNDMHGKPKGAKQISFNSNGTEEVLSSVEYEYFDEQKLTTNRAGETFITRKLKNDVDLLVNDVDPTNLTQSKISQGTLATEIEFIPMTNYQQSRSISAGIELNFEQIGVLPMFFPIPNFNWKEEKLGTVVTNKIVNKSGIVKKVKAVERGSMVETQNLLFDPLTGAAVLSTVTNDFNDKIYNYSILANEYYEKAGAQYENIGSTGYLVSSGNLTNGIQSCVSTVGLNLSIPQFFEGDVVLMTPKMPDNNGTSFIDDNSRAKEIAIFNSKNITNGSFDFELKNQLNGLYSVIVIRSGKRNKLSLPISNITSLSDPTKNREVVNCEARSPFQLITLDNVLSINAVELGDKWYKDSRQISSLPVNWYDNSLYNKGLAGVLSPVRSYAYVDNRVQNTTSGITDVKLKTDGVYNDVQLFDWNRILMESATPACKSKWKAVDQITLKNPSGLSLEAKNIINTYSSTLFDNGGVNLIAQAQNAKNAEIGFESFEDYTSGSIDLANNGTTNLNFYSTYNAATIRNVEDRFDIPAGYSGTSTIPVPYSTFSAYSSLMVRLNFDAYWNASGVFVPAKDVMLRLPMSVLQANGVNTTLTLPSNINVEHSDIRSFRGELFGKKTIPNYPSGGNVGVSVTNEANHTGMNSLKIMGSNGGKFLQGKLNLIQGKEYEFTGWFSTPENSSLLNMYNNYFTSNFAVEFFDASGNILSGQTKTYTEAEILKGSFIDDWQKFSLKFVVPANASYVSFTIPGAHEVYSQELEDYIQAAYFDDLRVVPVEAGMESFVYNKESLRLEAVLDANNYATFYYYDDEGNLFLVKQETEKGIITVQESRNYLRKQ